MSQTSVGSGTPNDRNENPAPSDGYPSKTFGAESSLPPELQPESVRASVPEASSPEPAESDAADLPSPMDAAHGAGNGQGMAEMPNMPDMPEGPNVGPSAWELQAAQGQPDPQDPAPRLAAGV